MEDHSYIEFIKMVMEAGHQIQWDERQANLVLRNSQWKVKAFFSYNETKIYFDFGQPHPLRVLDGGRLSADFINELDQKLNLLKSVYDRFEG